MDNKLNLMVSFIGSDKLSGALRNIIGLGKTGSQALKGMKDSARALERELAGVRREIAGGAGNMTQLINRERELASAVSGANAKLEQQKRLLANNAKGEAMSAKGEDFKSRGRDNIVGGASLAAPLILAAKAAGDFSSGMVDIQQKADLSDKATKRLKDNIILAAAAAKKMPEDMRAGMDVLLGKGMGVDPAAKILPSIGRLSTAFKVDMADGAASAYANINNLKVPVSQTAKAFDVMAASGNMGAFEIKDMARHFPMLTAQLQALGEVGVPAVADLSAALQVAEKGTGNADQAANNIQNLLTKINAPGTITAFKKNFGVDLPAAMKKLTDEGYSSLEAIALVTQKATGGDLKKISFGFEDMQAQGGLRAIIQNLEEYRRIRKEAGASNGIVDKAFDQRVLNDANVSWEAFKGSVSTLAITLGTTLLPVITSTFNWINSTALAVSHWAQAHPEAAGFIMQAVGALAAFRIGLGALQFMFGGLLGPMGKALTYFLRFRQWGGITRIVMGGVATWQKMGPIFSMVGSFGARAFGLLSRGGMMAGRAILFVGRAFLMNPIGLLVTALAVGAYLIYTHWGTIKGAFFSAVAWLGQAWTAIKSAFMAGVSYIIGLHGKMLGIGSNIIGGLARGIMGAAGAVWNALKSVVMGGINKIKNFLGIKSPSRLFMEMGGHMASGMALGITQGGRKAIGAAGRLATGVAAAGALSLSPAGAAAFQSGNSGGSGAMASAAPVTMYVTIQIEAGGRSAKSLAQEIKQELDKLAGVESRREYDDGE